jgi:site-specific recombinase XerD
MSVEELWEKFLTAKSHLKKNSLVTYGTTRKSMIRHFGPDRLISSVSRLEIETLFGELSKVQSACSVSTLFRRFRAVFEFAVRQGFLSENPFAVDIRRVDVNESRWCYVEPATIRQVLSCCRNDRERLAAALGISARMFSGCFSLGEVMG